MSTNTVPTIRPPLQSPLPLPKFTFLFGPPESGQTELTKAIAARDDSLGVYDLEEPLRRATHELFFGGFDVDRDLTDPAQRDQLALPPYDKTVGDWIRNLYNELSICFDPSVLARIAFADFLRNEAELHIFERILFRDTRSPGEVSVFSDHFGGQNILCIHVGQLSNLGRLEAVRHIWLPEPSTDSRMAALECELSTRG